MADSKVEEVARLVEQVDIKVGWTGPGHLNMGHVSFVESWG